MINPDVGTMRLIDFEFSGQQRIGHYPPRRLPKDIKKMKQVVKRLFPDLYFRAKHGATLTDVEKQVVRQLVEALGQSDLKKQCTSEDALRYCREVIKLGDALTKETLNEISEATIHRQKITVEDVLRKPGLASK